MSGAACRRPRAPTPRRARSPEPSPSARPGALLRARLKNVLALYASWVPLRASTVRQGIVGVGTHLDDGLTTLSARTVALGVWPRTFVQQPESGAEPVGTPVHSWKPVSSWKSVAELSEVMPVMRS